MKAKRASAIRIFLCDECSAVHVGLFRDGKMFAEAIPEEPELVARDLAEAATESRRLRGERPN